MSKNPAVAIAFGDPLPPGPYAVGMTATASGPTRPFTVVCGDGRAIAGHVESKEIADAIADAMNAHSGGQMRARKPSKPTIYQTQMIRRIAGGRLLVTIKDGKPTFHYDDGSPCAEDSARRCITQGWVKPESPPLFGELAQSYVVPKRAP